MYANRMISISINSLYECVFITVYSKDDGKFHHSSGSLKFSTQGLSTTFVNNSGHNDTIVNTKYKTAILSLHKVSVEFVLNLRIVQEPRD